MAHGRPNRPRRPVHHPDALTGTDKMLAMLLQRYGTVALVAYRADYDAAHDAVRHLRHLLQHVSDDGVRGEGGQRRLV